MRQSKQGAALQTGLDIVSQSMRGARMRGGCCTPQHMLEQAYGEPRTASNGSSATSCPGESNSLTPASPTEGRLVSVLG